MKVNATLPPPDNPFGEEGFSTKQLQALRSTAPILLLLWGGGGGKTIVALSKLILNALANPGTLHCYAAPTIPNFEGNVFPKMEAIRRKFRRINGFDFVRRYRGKDLYCWDLINGSRIKVITYRNPETWRGPDVASIALDEVAAADEYIAGLDGGSLGMWEILQGRMRGVRFPQMILMTTPRGDIGLVGKILQQYTDGDPDVDLIVAASSENSALGPKYLDSQRRNLSPLMYAQEVLGKIIIFSQGFFGPVFSSEASIVDDFKIDFDEPILVGIDWGIVHPHIVLAQKRRDDDDEGGSHFVVFDEVYHLNQNNDAILQQFLERIDMHCKRGGVPGCRIRVFADPENRKAIGDLRRALEHERNITLCEGKIYAKLGKKYSSVFEGLKILQAHFLAVDGKRKLFLTKNLVKQCDGPEDRPLYEAIRQLKLNENGQFTQKRWKHPLDGLRYLVLGEGLRSRRQDG